MDARKHQGSHIQKPPSTAPNFYVGHQQPAKRIYIRLILQWENRWCSIQTYMLELLLWRR